MLLWPVKSFQIDEFFKHCKCIVPKPTDFHADQNCSSLWGLSPNPACVYTCDFNRTFLVIKDQHVHKYLQDHDLRCYVTLFTPLKQKKKYTLISLSLEQVTYYAVPPPNSAELSYQVFAYQLFSYSFVNNL